MEYELLDNRGFIATQSTPSMKLLYFYSKYRKQREEQRSKAASGNRVIRVSG
jgi:hypothetical protein